MATEQDLQAAIAALGQSITQYGTEVSAIQTEITALIAKLSAAGTIPDADLQALTALNTALGSSNANLQAAIDQVKAV